MKILKKTKDIIGKIRVSIKNSSKLKTLKEFDNADFNDDNLKKNILFLILFLMLILIFALTYFVIKKKMIDDSFETGELPPLKIVVPYPTSNINIDDYNILKYKVEFGDSLFNILIKNIGTSILDANNILLEITKVYNTKSLKAGHNIEIKYRITVDKDPNSDDVVEKIIVDEFRLETDEKDTEILATRDEAGKYKAKKSKVSLNKSILKYVITINESLFSDGISAGVPASIMMEFIKYLSFDIDFQRDLWKGDTFEVVFEAYFNDDGKKIRDGDILYANIKNQNREYNLYRFAINGAVNYFDKNGQSVQKSLLKTPINGARISSNFGVRKHPVLGYSKMHNGKDFAAPTGTPFFAAGSGTVVQAQFSGTWGNYVRIKHSNGYETEYAHASRIASGIRKGVKVRQGQVIAYVGTTGRSTGPHLHYGVLYNGARINPDRVKSLPSIKLQGKDLADFKIETEKIDLYRLNIPNQSLSQRR